MNKNSLKIIYLLTAVSLIVATYMIFTGPVPIDPGERSIMYNDLQWDQYKQSFKIFYFHVPLAWVAYLAFLVVFIASIRYLQTSNVKWDVLAASSAEIGVVFCSLNLLSGMIWAQGAWNTYWEWNPRLSIQLVLFLLYVAYTMLRRAIAPESRARSSAVFGIVAFIAVPMSYISIKLWETRHPDLTGEGGGIEDPIIIYTLLINILAYTLLYISLLTIKLDIERATQEFPPARNP